MEFTVEGRLRYDALVAVAARSVVGLDFDGVLSPIVADPAQAQIHPDGPAVLADLARQVDTVAVVTGRPARQAVSLGRLAEVARSVGAQGRVVVLGQYGSERWDQETGSVTAPEPPAGLPALERELPGLLSRADAVDAFVEHKRLAVAVHTRRMPRPREGYDRLLPLLRQAAVRHGLVVEPGRLAIEVRAPGADKGAAVRALRDETGAAGLLFAGDDLGDLPAFRAVAALRAAGVAGLLVCSASTEQDALVGLADVVVDGPPGVLDLLRRLTRDAARPA